MAIFQYFFLWLKTVHAPDHKVSCPGNPDCQKPCQPESMRPADLGITDLLIYVFKCPRINF
ncbi:MAG: hypothetical protein Ct9H300mP28_35370 [Pseudomonadota bacterium]|nr:MAG: hypothetical protein Ct9H300mP28_35370 [Pseudomonadota bacterium]